MLGFMNLRSLRDSAVILLVVAQCAWPQEWRPASFDDALRAGKEILKSWPTGHQSANQADEEERIAAEKKLREEEEDRIVPKREMSFYVENRLRQLPLGDASKDLEKLELEGIKFDKAMIDVVTRPELVEEQIRELVAPEVADRIAKSLKSFKAKIDVDFTSIKDASGSTYSGKVWIQGNNEIVRVAGFVMSMGFDPHRHVEAYKETTTPDIRSVSYEEVEMGTETVVEKDSFFSKGRVYDVKKPMKVQKTKLENVGEIVNKEPIFKKQLVTEEHLNFVKQMKERMVLEGARLMLPNVPRMY